MPDPLTRTLEGLLAIVARRCDCPLCDVHELGRAWSELLLGATPPWCPPTAR